MGGPRRPEWWPELIDPVMKMGGRKRMSGREKRGKEKEKKIRKRRLMG